MSVLKRLFVFALVFIPMFVFSQDANQELNETLKDNNFIVEHIGQLAPMAINPYLTLFVTSVLSKMGVHNDLVATNPLFGNYFVMILSFLLLVVTTLPKFFTKLAAPISITAEYLNNKASVVITILIILLPSFINKAPLENDPIVYKAGMLSVSMSTLMLIIVSAYYLIVVMSVRLFLEILIFLTPVPLIDAVFEVCKWVFTLGLVLIGVFFPKFSLVITGVSFVVSLFFFNKAKRYITLAKYLIISPILKKMLFKSPDVIDESIPNSIENTLGSRIELAIPVILKVKSGSINKGSKVWLTKSDKGIFLSQKRWLRPSLFERIDDTLTIVNNNIDIDITNTENTISLVMSKFYKPLVPVIGNLLSANVKENNVMSSLKKLSFGFSFSQDDKKELKGIAE